MNSLNKRKKWLFNFTVMIDALTTSLAWFFAYYFRFHLPERAFPTNFFLYTPFLILFNVFFHYRFHCYEPTPFSPWYRKVTGWVKGAILSFILFVFLYYYTHSVPISRLGLLIYISALITLQSLSIPLIWRYENYLRKRHLWEDKILCIGDSDHLFSLLQSLHPFREGQHCVGWLDPKKDKYKKFATENKIPTLDIPLETLPAFIKKNEITHVFIGFFEDQSKQVGLYTDILSITYCRVYFLPLIRTGFLGYEVESIHRQSAIRLNAFHATRTSLFLKRTLDVVGSLTALLLFSPLFISLSLLIKFSSKGPIFFSQERVTLDGVLFQIWKFRSMRTDAEEKSGAVWATKNDSRVTTVGKMMRKTSLDEIPQFWNILKGDMSLVGPRPERPVFVEKFEREIAGYGLRHRVKAGLTGWAQINGLRGDTSIKERSRYDNQYIRNWSIWLDLKIIALTFIHGFFDENAY